MCKKVLHFVLILVIFASCIDNQQKKSEFCINNELSQCIEEYIKENEYKIAIYGNEHDLLYNIYYTLFFFNRDTANYFTIWESFIPANPKNIFIEEHLLIDTNFLYYRISERDVFIINGTNNKENILFSSCEENILLGKKKQNIDEVPIYDGSLYPATYKYSNKDGNIIIKKMDTTLLYFSSGWTEYEELQKKKQESQKSNAEKIKKTE